MNLNAETTGRRRLTRAEQQARTRAALLEAAARVFVERGFAGSSVEAITENAGYSRGAFYSNFESKEQLFAELLQERVYVIYREMAEKSASGTERATMREVGEQLAAIQADPDGRWLFRLWLELLAHSGRDDRFKEIAAGFWQGTRARSADAIAAAYEAQGRTPEVAPDHLATAMIALDIGLAIQNFVDPAEVPLALYPELYALLFPA
jgi:AcrR family transcriptional regulator